MAVTEVQTVDVSQALAMILGDVDGLRTSWHVSDASRPPVAIIGLPTIDWKDPDSTFCWATWEYPITIVTARNNDRDAQMELSRLVRDVAVAINSAPDQPGIFSIEMLDARPTSTTISGQEMPSYHVRVQVRA